MPYNIVKYKGHKVYRRFSVSQLKFWSIQQFRKRSIDMFCHMLSRVVSVIEHFIQIFQCPIPKGTKVKCDIFLMVQSTPLPVESYFWWVKSALFLVESGRICSWGTPWSHLVGGLEHGWIMTFHILGIMILTDELIYFSEGLVETTKQSFITLVKL